MVKHLAIFLPSLEGGGAERVMVDLASAFTQQGRKVDLVLVKAHGAYLQNVPPGINIIDLSARNSYTCFLALRKYIFHSQPDLLITTLELTSLIALLMRVVFRTKNKNLVRIAITLSSYPRSRWKKKFERFLLKHLYPLADQIVTVSKDVEKDFLDYLEIDPERVTTIYNPVISSHMIELSREPLTHPWFQDGGPPVILAVGRLAKQKDFPTLIQAFALVKKITPVRLVILGEGRERDDLERLLTRLELSQDVLLPGFMNNPFNFMRKSACFVLSSQLEGLPNVLIQALACGCPVVSTESAGGVKEVLNNGQFGHLAPAGDAQAIATAILGVLKGDTRKPPEAWLDQFNVENNVKEYLRLIDRG